MNSIQHISSTFEDNVLLRIRRQYSKDEAIAVLNKRLSTAEFKNGELLSEIAELKNEIQLLKNPPLQVGEKKKRKQWLKDDVIAKMNEEKKELHDKLLQKTREAELWMSKYFLSTNKIKQ